MKVFEENVLQNQNKTVPKSKNVPIELKKCYIDINITSILRDISKGQKLSYIAEKAYTKLCFDFLYQYFDNSHGFIQKLELTPEIRHEGARNLALKFKEKILDEIILLLKKYNLNINDEIVFFETGHLRVTNKFIYYSKIKQRQPILNVSNIEIQKKFLSPKFIIYFEVFIPQEDRWGRLDRPSFILSKEEAYNCADKIEKAISLSKFLLMYENILI